MLRHRRVGKLHLFGKRLAPSSLAGKEKNSALFAVINSLKFLAGAYGPVHGAGVNAKLAFHLFAKVKGVFGISVHFIYKGKNRNMPHGADLKKLAGLRFHALASVNDHNRGIRRHKGAVGVLGKILVAGRVKNVYAKAVIYKLHDRGGNGNSALLFNLHPVGGCGLGLFALYLSRLGDGSAVKQKFFRKGGFARVRVRNNGKGSSSGYFFFKS